MVAVAALAAIAFFAGASGAGGRPRATARAADGPDLYVRDTPTDTGVEPNPDTGPMWVSEDIWVRTSPDPGYQPYPFTAASPPWTPLPNENPEYRDPKYGVPNWVYVRVRNRGTTASTGSERLRVYFAKASTGLSWPAQWTGSSGDGYVVGSTLYGDEITKPRLNAATATQAERDAYVQAIKDAGSLPAFKFVDGVSYWHKQQQIHAFGPTNRHGTPAFLPWHRDFVNRYEALLQQVNPTVKLLYWDWTTDPAPLTGFNFFTNTFMGASGRGSGVPVSIGAPFMPTIAPPTVTRQLSSSTTPPASPDASIIGGNPTWPNFASVLENVPNHNSAHGYIGGGGPMCCPSTAAQDPFFFLLHANVDRIWAQWQRDVSDLTRLDPALTYGTLTTNSNITTTMAPWDGTGTPIEPYTATGGYVVSQKPTDAAIVSPPIYDTALLTIPSLQPGQAVVLQIPWYPPNPADFASFGPDQGHFCLVARIETTTSSPFGMTFPEGTDLYTNTRNNNKIAWKNITVVDNFPGAFRPASALIRNVFRQIVPTTLHFRNVAGAASFLELGRLTVDLKPQLYKRWLAGGAKGKGIKRAGGTTIAITSPNAFISNIRLGPGDTFAISPAFQLNAKYKPTRALAELDVMQTGNGKNPNAVVGGQRFEVDASKLVHVKTGDLWRYLDNGSNPGSHWFAPTLDDSKWRQGPAPLGFGDNVTTTIDGGPAGKRHIATYFRHAFDVADPAFSRTLLLKLRRDDGAVVYLNGKEVYRVNMRPGVVTPKSPATRDVHGLERDVFFPVAIKPQLLRKGTNIVAVEIHLASPKSTDLTIDLELDANPATTATPPSVAFAAPADGALFQVKRPIGISAEAIDPDGKVISVVFYADGKPIGKATKPPYAITWQGARLGAHRLRAVATDNQKHQALAWETISVLTNTPPAVTLTSPADGASFRTGESIIATAQASDPAGAVSRVEFHVRRMLLFTDPDKIFGVDESPPYQATLKDLAPGEYMVSAVTVDNQGLSSPSLPAMIMIGG